MVVVCPLWASLARFCVRFVYYLLELLEKNVFNTGMLQNDVKSHVCLFFLIKNHKFSQERKSTAKYNKHISPPQIEGKHSGCLNSFCYYSILTYLKHSRVNPSSYGQLKGATCGFFFILLYVRVWEDPARFLCRNETGTGFILRVFDGFIPVPLFCFNHRLKKTRTY